MKITLTIDVVLAARRLSEYLQQEHDAAPDNLAIEVAAGRAVLPSELLRALNGAQVKPA